MKTAHENELSKALEFIKSKHNGEIPYKYGSMECAKLMTQFASQFREPSTEQSGGTESETGEQEDKPAVTITLSFDVPTFGKFISLMRTNDELWPDFKESLMQLKDKIESWKEMK